MDQVTEILAAARAGDSLAAARLFEMVYSELRQIAARKMSGEPLGHTLQPTALVHEAWLRLGGPDQPDWANRAHFFTAAAEAMRRILVECARRKRALKRGGEKAVIDLGSIDLASAGPDERVLEVNEALERFAQVDPLKAELVKLRYFVGATLPETAALLGISEATAKRYWVYARAWLLRAMR
jgi:RNA polymerase sigma factor (TIGR02999 family)